MASANPFDREHRDHFTTVRLSMENNEIVNMSVSYWPIASYGAQIPWAPATTFEFKLGSTGFDPA
jgi:hypothetical protein